MTPAEVIAAVIEAHVGRIGTHYEGCWKYHAGCLAMLLQEMYEEEALAIGRVEGVVPDAVAERDAAVAAIERVREIHRKDARLPDWPECTHCTVGMLQDPVDWPCPTIQALDGVPEPEPLPVEGDLPCR